MIKISRENSILKIQLKYNSIIFVLLIKLRSEELYRIFIDDYAILIHVKHVLLLCDCIFIRASFSSVSVCNITLDSRQLFSKSDRGFGQIKSPYLQGPSRCTYRFVPDTGQRVELQIYRLVSIGRHNGTA